MTTTSKTPINHFLYVQRSENLSHINTRFYPYFGFCYIYLYFAAKLRIKSFRLYYISCCWQVHDFHLVSLLYISAVDPYSLLYLLMYLLIYHYCSSTSKVGHNSILSPPCNIRACNINIANIFTFQQYCMCNTSQNIAMSCTSLYTAVYGTN